MVHTTRTTQQVLNNKQCKRVVYVVSRYGIARGEGRLVDLDDDDDACVRRTSIVVMHVCSDGTDKGNKHACCIYVCY